MLPYVATSLLRNSQCMLHINLASSKLERKMLFELNEELDVLQESATHF